MLIFWRNDLFPMWLVILILAMVTLVGVYFVLPRAKGVFIALMWLFGSTGRNEFSDPTEPQD